MTAPIALRLAQGEVHVFAHRDVVDWAPGYPFTGQHCTHDGQHWPCATVFAIENALKP